MPDGDVIDRAQVEECRARQLQKCKIVFGLALDLVGRFRELAAEHPEDDELMALVNDLNALTQRLLQTVTCKVIANGMAAEYDHLFGTEDG